MSNTPFQKQLEPGEGATPGSQIPQAEPTRAILEGPPMRKSPVVGKGHAKSLRSTVVHNDGNIEHDSDLKLARRSCRHRSKSNSTTTVQRECQSSLDHPKGQTPSSHSIKSVTSDHRRSLYHDPTKTNIYSPHMLGTSAPQRPHSNSWSRGEIHSEQREGVNEFGVLGQFSTLVSDQVTRQAPVAKETGCSTGNNRKRMDVGIDKRRRSRNFIKKAFHSSTSSRIYLVSSRRRSAEYSAQRASSLSNFGCWEVDISKALISLSLQEQNARSSAIPMVDPAIAFPGEACGYNKLSGDRDTTLDSPLFLQNSFPRSLKSKQGYSKTRRRESERAIESEEMSHDGHSVTSITISSTNQVPRLRGASPPSDNTPSRRTVGGINSVRSGSKTPPRQQEEKVEVSSSLLVPQLTLIGPTPEASPISPATPTRRSHHKSTPTMPPKSLLPPVIEKSHSSGSVKRKAEETDLEGEKSSSKETKAHKATFALDTKAQLVHAPSSYNRSKRVRLTNASEGGRSTMSQTSPVLAEASPSSPTAKNTGSLSSRGSHGPRSAAYIFSREGPPLARSASRASHSYSFRDQGGHRAPSRKSLSQASIPISALVSPHAPSIAHSGTFHMRDPRKPPPIQGTPWTLNFPDQWQEGESRWSVQNWVARGGSPRHAWLFFIGFILFPLWWFAAFLNIPRTRRIGATDAEKGVALDDPQIEHDARSWRFRCRVMALLSLITYIPFIVLIVVFTHR